MLALIVTLFIYSHFASAALVHHRPPYAPGAVRADYACLPPLKLENFRSQMRFGRMDKAVPLDGIRELSYDRESGLVVRTFDGVRSPYGELILSFGNETGRVELRSLIGVNAGLNRSEILRHMERGLSQEPLAQRLFDVAKRTSYNVFVSRLLDETRQPGRTQLDSFAERSPFGARPLMRSGNFLDWHALEAEVPRKFRFLPLIRSGVIVFASDDAAIVLARNFSTVGLCSKIENGQPVVAAFELESRLKDWFHSEAIAQFFDCQQLLIN